jgi:AraC-like DNA-binding protein/quercetin dioxygenase-like cupin family protein
MKIAIRIEVETFMPKTKPDAKSPVLSEYRQPDLRLSLQLFAPHARKVLPGWTYERHQHPLFELNMVMEGQQLCETDKESFVMGPGELILLKPDEYHACSAVGSSAMRYCCIHFEVDEPSLRQALCSIASTRHKAGSPLADALSPVMCKAAGKIAEHVEPASLCGKPGEDTHAADGNERAAARNEGASRWSVLALAFELMTSLGAIMENPPPGLLSDSAGGNRLASRIADQLAKLVEERQSADQADAAHGGIADISRELGYSVAYCNRVFKGVFGMSPRQYLSTLLLREAKLMLLNRQLTIDVISERLGYRDVSQFSKQFKRWTNVSPSQFRQMLG